ncbi:MAG TPA: DNA translocase FtsK 4TM domain-containing protein, partial [Patescibacteria group bacterium]|nr:DNA translocase FtsK 4TM domain-containing protein [Patescibacteria group bacterium]
MKKLLRRMLVLPRLNELVGLFMIFAVIILAMALVSYNPSDLSFLSRDSSQTVSRNLAGRFGATIAELMYQIFGLASWFLLVPLAQGGWRRLWSRKGMGLGAAIFGYGGMLAGLLCLLTMIIGGLHVGNEEVLAGGVLGAYLDDFLVTYLNTAGAFVISVAFMVLGATIATHISFGNLLVAARKLCVEALRRGRTWLTHWRETRRKQKLREQIVKKHAKKAEAVVAPA